MRHEETWI